MILYCDKCGEERKLPIPSPLGTEKGECEICQRRLGTMNILFSSDTDRMEDIMEETVTLCGFNIEQLHGFIPKSPIYNIHNGDPKLVSNDCVLYIEPDKIILARISTGIKVQITF